MNLRADRKTYAVLSHLKPPGWSPDRSTPRRHLPRPRECERNRLGVRRDARSRATTRFQTRNQRILNGVE